MREVFMAESANEPEFVSRASEKVAPGTLKPGTWLGELLSLRLAGAHLADGTDADDHIRELRRGWDSIND